MIDDLLNKILSWTPQHADTFYNNLPRDTEFGKFLWETTETGTFLYSDSAATFFHNNGTIFKLTCRYFNLKDDWDLHCKLYSQVLLNKNCQIEIPLHGEMITFKNQQWMYTVVQRPENQYGVSLFDDMLIGNIDTNYLSVWIDDASIMFNELILLHHQTGCNLPRVFPKRIKTSNGIAWVDFKRWDYSYEEFITMHTAIFYRTLLKFESQNKIYLDKARLLNKVRTKWGQL